MPSGARLEKELVVLDNGLACVLAHARGATASSVQMWFRAGSALEGGADLGVAHFLEHMFFKGTARRPGPELVRDVESLGSEINAFTSLDYTSYYINAPDKHLPRALEMLMDMMCNPVFKDGDVESERDVVLEEHRRSVDSPSQHAFSRIQRAFFSGGYAHPILGEERTIRRFSRRQVVSFRRSFYNARNAFLVVAGDLGGGRRRSLARLAGSFRFPSGRTARFPTFRLRRRPAVDVHAKDVANVDVHLCVESGEWEGRDAPAEVLGMDCLGLGDSSRLHRGLVVEAPLASSASASTMFMRRGGVHFVRASVPPGSLDGTLRALADLLAGTAREGFSGSEVDKVKNQYVATKVFNRESLESFASATGFDYAQTGDLDGGEKFVERVRETGASSVNRLFREVLARPVHVALQVPRGFSPAAAERMAAGFQKRLAGSLRGRRRPSRGAVSVSRDDPELRLVRVAGGARLLHRRNPGTPSFVLQGSLHGGQAAETRGLAGLHHLLASLLAKGHRDAGQEELQRVLDERSASLAGFSGRNGYGVTVHGLTAHFGELAGHLLGSLARPRLDPSAVRREKRLVLRSIDEDARDPMKICVRRAAEALFGRHPYALPLKGTRSSARALGREALARGHRGGLSRGVLLSYAGDLGLDEVLPVVEAGLEGAASRARARPARRAPSPSPGPVHVPLEREQTHVFTGVPSPGAYHPEQAALRALTAFLGGQSSPLFVEVRDRLGLCYSVAPVHLAALEGGYWGIYIASGNDRAQEALDAIRRIIRDVRDGAVTGREFARVKRMIEGQSLVRLQTNEDHVTTHSPHVMHGGGIDHFHDANRALRALTRAEFLRCVAGALDREWVTVSVGSRVSG